MVRPEERPGRCPTCGRGRLADVSFDVDPRDASADGSQEAESRQLETYSCGHEVLGPMLSTADQHAMTVERRTSEDSTTPVTE
jgi:hypothetical protein